MPYKVTAPADLPLIAGIPLENGEAVIDSLDMYVASDIRQAGGDIAYIPDQPSQAQGTPKTPASKE